MAKEIPIKEVAFQECKKKARSVFHETWHAGGELPDDHWNFSDNVKNTENEMAPSDSKDNNCRATSFSWIVSTCINIFQPSKLKSSWTEKIRNSWPGMAPCAKTGVYGEVAEAPRHEASDTDWYKIWCLLHPVPTSQVGFGMCGICVGLGRSTLWDVRVLKQP